MKNIVVIAVIAFMALTTSTIAQFESKKSVANDCFERKGTNSRFFFPVMLWGFSFNFEERVLSAFPVGSCEISLTRWLDKQGFSPALIGYADAVFMDESDENSRYINRLSDNREIKLRYLKKPTLVGNSFFSVAWTSDEDGKITEIYTDIELFHLDLP